jgi:hypothetical protein
LVRRRSTSAEIDTPHEDGSVIDQLDEIERENTPERLLSLARELEEKLLVRRQRERPN